MSAVTFPLYNLPFLADRCTMLTAVSPMPLLCKAFFWAGGTNSWFLSAAVAFHSCAGWTLVTKQHLRGHRVSVLVLRYLLVGPCKTHGKQLRKNKQIGIQFRDAACNLACMYTLKNAGLNTTQCWSKYWTEHMLGCFQPNSWVKCLTQPCGQHPNRWVKTTQSLGCI